MLTRLLVCGIVVGVAGWMPVMSSAQEPAATSNSTLGAVQGRVRYQADPARPWRYARYYIKYASRGDLAEAVVALNARGLKGPPNTKPALARIEQKDFRFVPETVAIRAGDSVRFTNDDSTVHNVRTYDGSQPFNVNTPVGAEYTHRFDVAGGIRRPLQIGCNYHSQMQAWIFVFAHPYFQLTGVGGEFRIADVPPGEYELETFHPAGNLRVARRIMVRAGETTQIDVSLSPDNLVEP